MPHPFNSAERKIATIQRIALAATYGVYAAVLYIGLRGLIAFERYLQGQGV